MLSALMKSLNASLYLLRHLILDLFQGWSLTHSNTHALRLVEDLIFQQICGSCDQETIIGILCHELQVTIGLASSGLTFDDMNIAVLSTIRFADGLVCIILNIFYRIELLTVPW